MKTFCSVTGCNYESVASCMRCGLVVCPHHIHNAPTVAFDKENFWVLRSQLRSGGIDFLHSPEEKAGTYRRFYEDILPMVTLPTMSGGAFCDQCNREWKNRADSIKHSIDRALIPAVKQVQARGLICQFDDWCLLDVGGPAAQCSKCGRHLCPNHIATCKSCKKVYCVDSMVWVTKESVDSYWYVSGGCGKDHGWFHKPEW